MCTVRRNRRLGAAAPFYPLDSDSAAALAAAASSPRLMVTRAALALALAPGLARAAPWFTATQQRICSDEACQKCAPSSQAALGACTLGTAATGFASFAVSAADDGKTAALQFFYGARGFVNCSLPAGPAERVPVNSDVCTKFSTPQLSGSVTVGPVLTWWAILLISLASVLALAIVVRCLCPCCCRKKAAPAGLAGAAPAAYAFAPPPQYGGTQYAAPHVAPEAAVVAAPPPPYAAHYAAQYSAQYVGYNLNAAGSGYTPPPISSSGGAGVTYGDPPPPGAIYGGPPPGAGAVRLF